jgi:hypothetical protein
MNKLIAIMVILLLVVPGITGCQPQPVETIDGSLTLEITSPVEGSETTWGFIRVNGTVSPASAVVSIDKQGYARVDADGSFESDYIVLNEGKNDIHIRATAGDEEVTRTVSVNYTLDLRVSISPGLEPGRDWLTESPAKIGGRVSDLRAEVTINGQKAAMTNDGYILAMVELSEGTNTLTAVARLGDQTANDTCEAVYVPPPSLAIEIITPDEGFESKLDIVKIAGTVSDPEADVVISNTAANGSQSPVIDSVPARITAGGHFYAYVTLEKGNNRIDAAALRGSDRASDTIDIGYNPPPVGSATEPELRITSPQNNEEYRINVLTVTGMVDDPGAIVLVNGTEAVVGVDGGFQGYSVLTETGENTIEVIALGDEAKAVQTITVTFVPPLVVYLNADPEPGIDYTKEPLLSVTGTVNKPEASVTVNAEGVPVDEHGLFKAQVLLKEGFNKIKAIATLNDESDEIYILYGVENGVLIHVPGYSHFFDSSLRYESEARLKAGQTLLLPVTLETRKDGPGDFSGSFVYVDKEYGLLPLPWPEGLDACLEPPEFMAYPNATYNLDLVISTQPELDPGTYYLHFYHVFENSGYGSGWIKVTVE